jgi:hypothetical protein
MENTDLLRAGHWAGRWHQMTARQQHELREALERRNIARLSRLEAELAAKLNPEKAARK